MNISRTTVLVISGLLAVGQIHSQTDWEVEKNEDGIMVETRVTDLTPVKEFRANTIVRAPMQKVIETLLDVENHPDWMMDITHAERISDTPEILYYNIKTPFPMKDRYIVVDVETFKSDSVWRMNMSNSDTEPDRETGDHVHIPIVRGYWEFKPIDNNMTHVQYQFLSDPGLKMPDWLINMFIVNNPYKTLKNLRKRLE